MNSNWRERFREVLLLVKSKDGLGPRALSEKAGLGPNYLSQVVSGKDPKISCVLKVLELLPENAGPYIFFGVNQNFYSDGGGGSDSLLHGSSEVSPESNMNKIPENIAGLMAQNGFNQKSLALAANLNETAIRDILKGNSKSPRISTLNAIAAQLSVPVEVLWSDDFRPDEIEGGRLGKGIKSRTFKERLRLAIETSHDLTESSLANKAGLDNSTIRKLLAGKAEYPRLDTALKICGALGVTIEEFMEDAGAGPFSRFELLSDSDKLLVESLIDRLLSSSR